MLAPLLLLCSCSALFHLGRYNKLRRSRHTPFPRLLLTFPSFLGPSLLRLRCLFLLLPDLLRGYYVSSLRTFLSSASPKCGVKISQLPPDPALLHASRPLQRRCSHPHSSDRCTYHGLFAAKIPPRVREPRHLSHTLNLRGICEPSRGYDLLLAHPGANQQRGLAPTASLFFARDIHFTPRPGIDCVFCRCCNRHRNPTTSSSTKPPKPHLPVPALFPPLPELAAIHPSSLQLVCT